MAAARTYLSAFFATPLLCLVGIMIMVKGLYRTESPFLGGLILASGMMIVGAGLFLLLQLAISLVGD